MVDFYDRGNGVEVDPFLRRRRRSPAARPARRRRAGVLWLRLFRRTGRR